MLEEGAVDSESMTAVSTLRCTREPERQVGRTVWMVNSYVRV
jgi:hypothetical protein